MDLQVTKNPNPQGKGLSPTVGLLYEFEHGMLLPAVQEDSFKRVIEDYIGSLFVLSCKFQFKPVRGTRYYIYLQKQEFILSLISPREGGDAIFEEYFGSCMLQDDFSWKVECVNPKGFDLILSVDAPLDTEGFYNDLIHKGQYDRFINDILHAGVGKYQRQLGYYQNVLNYILGKTVTLRSKRLLECGGGHEGPNTALPDQPQEPDVS